MVDCCLMFVLTTKTQRHKGIELRIVVVIVFFGQNGRNFWEWTEWGCPQISQIGADFFGWVGGIHGVCFWLVGGGEQDAPPTLLVIVGYTVLFALAAEG
jgi:hypothetical protein